MKYRISLVTFVDPRADRYNLSWSGTPYYCEQALKKRFQVIGKKILNLSKKDTWSKEKVKIKFKVIEKRYQESKPDFTLLLYSYFLKGAQQPFVMYLNVPLFKVQGRLRLFRALQKTFKKAKVIFTLSEYVRKEFVIKEYGIIPSKVVTVGAGPNLRRLPSINTKEFDGKTIFFVGREVRRKGGLVLLEAFKKVKEKIPDARLVMISKDLHKYSKGRKLKEYDIIVRGLANKRTLGYWYHRASVFVMPSLFELFGIAFLEAMAYKLPCIGTNICAMPEIIDDGKTGFLVKPKDAAGLAERIIYLLRHKQVSRRMGELGRAKVEQYYSWDYVARRMEEHMKMALNRKAKL